MFFYLNTTEVIKVKSSEEGLPDNHKRPFGDALVGVVIGSIITVVSAVLVVVVSCVACKKKKKCNRTVLDSVLFSSEDGMDLQKRVPHSLNGGGKVMKGNVYKSIAMSELLDKEDCFYKTSHPRMEGPLSLYDLPMEQLNGGSKQAINSSLHQGAIFV